MGTWVPRNEKAVIQKYVSRVDVFIMNYRLFWHDDAKHCTIVFACDQWHV